MTEEHLNNEEQQDKTEQVAQPSLPEDNAVQQPETLKTEESSNDVVAEPVQPVVEETTPAQPVEPIAEVAPEVEAKAEEKETPAEPVAEPVVEPVAAEQPTVEETQPVEEAKADEGETPAAETSPEEAVVAPEAEEKPKGEAKWYVIQTFTGHEDKVKKAIDLTVILDNLKDKVTQVLVPTEEIVEIKGGKRQEKIKKMFPGYVFLEMVLDEETWYHIRQTTGVARFIGSKVKPTPVSGKEMQRVLKQLGKEERLEITFEKGEAVRVISGPFRGYTGTVDEVNEEKGKLKVLINIFGRDTPVEVNFEHAQKIV